MEALWIDDLAEAPEGELRPVVWVRRLEAPAGDAAEGRLARRQTLKQLAGRVFQVSPEAVVLDRAEPGGLKVAAPRAAFASVAGRGALIAAALSPVPVGVDIEPAAPTFDLPFDALDEDAQAALAGLDPPARIRAFLRRWTAIEAHLKAHGLGFGQTAPSQVQARARPDGIALRGPGTRRTLAALHEDADHVAALVLLP